MKKTRWIDALPEFAWVCLVLAGIVGAVRYNHDPGPMAAQVAPDLAAVAAAEDGLKIVVAIHPKCFCSHATADELAQIIRDHQGTDVSIDALIYRTPEKTPSWTQTELLESIEKLPGVNLVDDVDGRRAESMGLWTSGSLVVIRDQQVQFCGGITPQRGHRGPNSGTEAVEQALRGMVPSVRRTSAYGCPVVSRSKTKRGPS